MWYRPKAFHVRGAGSCAATFPGMPARVRGPAGHLRPETAARKPTSLSADYAFQWPPTGNAAGLPVARRAWRRWSPQKTPQAVTQEYTVSPADIKWPTSCTACPACAATSIAASRRPVKPNSGDAGRATKTNEGEQCAPRMIAGCAGDFRPRRTRPPQPVELRLMRESTQMGDIRRQGNSATGTRSRGLKTAVEAFRCLDIASWGRDRLTQPGTVHRRLWEWHPADTRTIRMLVYTLDMTKRRVQLQHLDTRTGDFLDYGARLVSTRLPSGGLRWLFFRYRCRAATCPHRVCKLYLPPGSWRRR